MTDPIPSASSLRACLRLSLGCAVFAGAAGLRASLWENPDWALTAQADGSAGYDSDITGVHDGPSDSFATFKPSLEFLRRDSELNFTTDAWVEGTAFARETSDDSIDPGVRLAFSYPANVDTPPTQEGEIHWIRTTDINSAVGQRVSQDDALAKYDGQIYDSGKLAVTGRASFDHDDYLGAAFDTINTGSVGTAAWYRPYAPDDLFGVGLGYDLTLANATPHTPGFEHADQTEQAVTLQAEGRFTPTLTGRAEAGAAYSDYGGFFSRSEWDAVAKGDLDWSPAARTTLELEAARSPTFDIEGDVALASSLSLTLRQEMEHGFAFRIDGLTGTTDYEQTSTFRTDSLWGGGAGLDYNLTGKLIASVGDDYTHQHSDIGTFTYGRNVITGKLQYQF